MNNRNRFRLTALTLAALLAVGALLSAPTAEAAKPPVGRTYFIVSIGVASDATDAYELDVGCLQFKREVLCDTDGDCGTWWRIDEDNPAARQWAAGFEFDLTDDETGLPIHIEGRGRIDGRGPKSALAGVAHGVETTSGVTINFAFAGRAVGATKCRRLVADFEADREQARGGR